MSSLPKPRWVFHSLSLIKFKDRKGEYMAVKLWSLPFGRWSELWSLDAFVSSLRFRGWFRNMFIGEGSCMCRVEFDSLLFIMMFLFLTVTVPVTSKSRPQDRLAARTPTEREIYFWSRCFLSNYMSPHSTQILPLINEVIMTKPTWELRPRFMTRLPQAVSTILLGFHC